MAVGVAGADAEPVFPAAHQSFRQTLLLEAKAFVVLVYRLVRRMSKSSNQPACLRARSERATSAASTACSLV